MKILLFTLILVLSFSFGTLAQTNETPPCPDFSIIGPPGIVKPNESASFTVVVDTKEKNLKLEYAWVVDSGTILEGQGTQTVTVKQPINNSVIVTVSIKGFPDYCCGTASALSNWQPSPEAAKLDQFSESIFQIDKARIEKITSVLQNEPSAQLYIITGFKKNTSLKSIKRKEQEIRNQLAKAEIEKDRIILIRVFTEVGLTQFWLVPAGAHPPEIK
jgi:hypothetical protein